MGAGLTPRYMVFKSVVVNIRILSVSPIYFW